jgi:WD40 repeat protein
VHKCSCSYNEQTMHDYVGHEGPVYAIRWSPFVPGVFVTCSADWTLRIWREDQEEAVRVVTTGSHTIADCAWSPRASTMLVTVDDTGLSVWDFAVEELDPVVIVPCPNGAKGTVVTLSPATPTVAFGDSDGRITVGILSTPPFVTELTADEQASRLLDILGTPSSAQH